MLEFLSGFMTPETTALIISWCLDLLYAVIGLIIGLWIIKILGKFLKKSIEKVITDEGLAGFLSNTIALLLKVILVISIASMLGVETASFLAILGSLGLAIGLALQGSLANFAGGIILLVFKPFTKGDFVTVKGEDGFIHKIDILYTHLLTRLHRIVVIPNSEITSGTIINHTHDEIVRRRWYLTIAYNSDVQKAKDAFYEAVDATPHILKDPKPFIEVSDINNNTVTFRIFIWVKPADYFRTKEPAIENIKYAWDKYGIKPAAPQHLVHLHSPQESISYGPRRTEG